MYFDTECNLPNIRLHVMKLFMKNHTVTSCLYQNIYTSVGVLMYYLLSVVLQQQQFTINYNYYCKPMIHNMCR